MFSLPKQGIGLSVQKEDGKASGEIPCESLKSKDWN